MRSTGKGFRYLLNQPILIVVVKFIRRPDAQPVGERLVTIRPTFDSILVSDRSRLGLLWHSRRGECKFGFVHVWDVARIFRMEDMCVLDLALEQIKPVDEQVV